MRFFLLLLPLLAGAVLAETTCKGELGEQITLCGEAKKIAAMEKRLRAYDNKIRFLDAMLKRQQKIIEELTDMYATQKVVLEMKSGGKPAKSVKALPEKFKASTFRTLHALSALNMPSKNGKAVRGFAEHEAFTSKSKSKGFLKVSGYFIGGKWTDPKQAMWVSEDEVKLQTPPKK